MSLTVTCPLSIQDKTFWQTKQKKRNDTQRKTNHLEGTSAPIGVCAAHGDARMLTALVALLTALATGAPAGMRGGPVSMRAVCVW